MREKSVFNRRGGLFEPFFEGYAFGREIVNAGADICGGTA